MNGKEVQGGKEIWGHSDPTITGLTKALSLGGNSTIMWYIIIDFIYLAHFYVQLGFPGGSVVKNPPPMLEMQIRSLGW